MTLTCKLPTLNKELIINLLVRYIFLSRCIYFGTFNGAVKAVSRTILFKHRI